MRKFKNLKNVKTKLATGLATLSSTLVAGGSVYCAGTAELNATIQKLFDFVYKAVAIGGGFFLIIGLVTLIPAVLPGEGDKNTGDVKIGWRNTFLGIILIFIRVVAGLIFDPSTLTF